LESQLNLPHEDMIANRLKHEFNERTSGTLTVMLAQQVPGELIVETGERS